MSLDYSDFAPIIGATVVVLVIVGMIWLICDLAIEADHQTDLLMAHCIADGHKDYECHGMLDVHNTVTPMPVYINGGG